MKTTLEPSGTSLTAGTQVPNLDLPDHIGRERRLSAA